MIGYKYPHRYFLCNKCEVETQKKKHFRIRNCKKCDKQFFSNSYHEKFVGRNENCHDCNKTITLNCFLCKNLSFTIKERDAYKVFDFESSRK